MITPVCLLYALTYALLTLLLRNVRRAIGLGCTPEGANTKLMFGSIDWTLSDYEGATVRVDAGVTDLKRARNEEMNERSGPDSLHVICRPE